MMKSRNYIIGVLLLSFSLLAACSNDSSNEEEENTANAETTENNIHKVDEHKEYNNLNYTAVSQSENALAVLNEIIDNSVEMYALYITEMAGISDYEVVNPNAHKAQAARGSELTSLRM